MSVFAHFPTTRSRAWSASSLSQLLGCGEQFRLARIEKVEPEFRPSSLVFGVCIHQALAELYLERLLGNEADLATVQDVFRDSWNDVLRNPDLPPVRFGKGEDETSLHKLGLEILSVFFANQVPGTEQIVAVEQRFEIQVAGGHAIVGYLVLFFAHPDLRTTPDASRRWSPLVGTVAVGFQGAIGISEEEENEQEEESTEPYQQPAPGNRKPQPDGRQNGRHGERYENCRVTFGSNQG